MELGANSIDIVSDGTLLLDGGAVFGQVPKALWEQQVKADRKNRVRMGLNCLLIRTPQANVLIDTGAGPKRVDKFRDLYGLNGNKLIKGLKKLSLTAREIDVVVLTSLRFHTAGGCTKLDRSGTAVPTFPKAKFMVQRACWEEALEPNERSQNYFYEDDYMPLEESGLVELMDGDQEIAPGVRTMVADGPSAGHQVVLVEIGSERIAFTGGLVPTPYHLSLPSIGAFDRSPNETLEQKREFLKMAVDGGWLMVFGQGHEPRAGYMEQRNGTAQLLPIEI